VIKDMPSAILWLALGVLVVTFAVNTFSGLTGNGAVDSPVILMVCISYLLDEICRRKKS